LRGTDPEEESTKVVEDIFELVEAPADRLGLLNSPVCRWGQPPQTGCQARQRVCCIGCSGRFRARIEVGRYQIRHFTTRPTWKWNGFDSNTLIKTWPRRALKETAKDVAPLRDGPRETSWFLYGGLKW